ncbi:hypothetical protein HWV62_7640 [Athelia sp. TMB]|nr:hypothetical protein HWV62_7640 [Athelia sp. TMB]
MEPQAQRSIVDEFSTNRHASQSKIQAFQSPLRHPKIGFEDGNIAIVTGPDYFLVHQGLLSRRSEYLSKLVQRAICENVSLLDGRPSLQLDDSSADMVDFLQALYDGIHGLKHNAKTFPEVASLLRLCTKYQVGYLRHQLLRGLSRSWPSTLDQWEERELKATDSHGIYAPRNVLAHPILVINLAREINAPELLPSAFYDLSRSQPSEAAAGYLLDSNVHRLNDRDLYNLFRGRESVSRFLSTFIVNELEGREPSQHCRYLDQVAPPRNVCQIAFETITFELLRDVNGVVCNRNSDPLYAIQDAELMQTRGDRPGEENRAPCRACEACRLDFGAVMDAARVEFWGLLPHWYGVEVENWG